MPGDRGPEVIAIASGKGGVGKTTVATNLAVELAQRGHRTMLFDADLGLANAQVALGVRTQWNFGHVLSGERSLSEVIVDTNWGVRLVPGGSGMRQLASLDRSQTVSIVQLFSTLDEDIDYLLIDLPAGISPSMLTLMQAAHRHVIVACDDPLSIADAYGTIKVLTQDLGLDTVHLLANQIPDEATGRQLFSRLDDVCRRFLGRALRPLPSIVRDEMVYQAARRYQPVVTFGPGSAAARDFRRLATAVEQLPPLDGPHGGIQFFIERLIERRMQ